MVGKFTRGEMESGREARLTGLEEDEHGVKIPVLRSSEESDHLHRRQIGQYNFICKGNMGKLKSCSMHVSNNNSPDPLAPDPFESKFVYVGSSRYSKEKKQSL